MTNSSTLGKEDQYGKNIDKCIKDFAVKVGIGLVFGGVFSLLFKRRSWPITLGGGIGLGMSYTTCENRFRGHNFKEFSINPKQVLQSIAPRSQDISPDKPISTEQTQPSESNT